MSTTENTGAKPDTPPLLRAADRLTAKLRAPSQAEQLRAALVALVEALEAHDGLGDDANDAYDAALVVLARKDQ